MKAQYSILANSLPRGGPFLLTSALRLLGYHKYNRAEQCQTPPAFNYLEAKKALQGREVAAGDAHIAISPFAPCYVEASIMRDWLGVLHADEFIMAHIAHTQGLSQALQGLPCRHIAIIRDPRALLLSLLFDTHPMPRFLIQPFAQLSASEQLEFMLQGGEVPHADMVLQPFAQMYRSMLAWQYTSDCLLVYFEDLVGPQGGGSHVQQLCALAEIADFLELEFDDAIAERLAEINDPSIPSFRLDQLAQWEAQLGTEIVERVLVECDALAEEAGYSTLLQDY